MSSTRSYPCVICSKRTKPIERRSLCGDRNKSLRKFLINKLFLQPNVVNEGVSCNKCRLFCTKEINKKEQKRKSDLCVQDVDYVPNTKICRSSSTTPRSPPSIQLNIPSSSSSHAQCVVCNRYGPKLVTVPSSAKYDLFIQKLIILPYGARCCPGHLLNALFSPAALEVIIEKKSSTDINRTDLTNLLTQIRDIALKNSSKRIDFDTPNALSESDIYNLTGLNMENFNSLCDKVQNSSMRDSHCRTIRTSLGIFLTKLKCGMSNRLLSTLFNMGRDATRRAIASARKSLIREFVPENLGFEHVTREQIIQNHTRPLAQSLFGNHLNPAIIVADGTYIYIQKSGNYLFQRRSYSIHKHRPLVKPMVFTSTSGYIISVLGPYMSDGKNNDANILNHALKSNVEKITNWLQEEDVLIVDRGFRDATDLLSDLGIKSEMPCFLPRGQKQHTVEESNVTRLVTKLRWVVESANGRIKFFRYLDKVLPTNQIPFIGDYVKIACAIINKYFKPLSVGEQLADELLGAKMKYLSKQINNLKEKVENEGLDKRSYKWSKIDSDEISNFPRLNEDELRNLTLGTYQIKMAKSYSSEHFNSDGNYEVLTSQYDSNLLSAKIQSRHTSAKSYQLWISYEEGVICGWFCKCKIGCRVVGMCSHIASVIWYLGFGKYTDKKFHVTNWGDYLLDAQNIPVPETIDSSDDEETNNIEE